ncbi:caspase domain-containing protein [Planctomycetota bacterium]
MRHLSLLIMLALVFAAGCGVTFTPLRQDPEVLGLKSVGTPHPFRVAVAPITAQYDREVYNVDVETEQAWIPEFDFEAQARDFSDLFNEFSVFRDADAYSAFDTPETEIVMTRAFEEFTDFVLKMEVARHKIVFEGFAGTHVPNMFLWFFFAVPSWYVHDEIFRSEIAFNVSLIDVYSGKALLEQTYEGIETRRLNDFERGWKLFGIFRAPGCLGAPNFEKVHNNLTRFSLKQAKVRMLKDMKAGVFDEKLASADFKNATRRTIAVCAGVSQYTDRTVPALKYAARDAELVQAMLTGTTGINPSYCRLLTDSQAYKKDIFAAMDNLGTKRCRRGDTFILSFAGYGVADGGEGYLVPGDCDPERVAETSISITELKEKLDTIHADNIILILDCAFSGSQRGRSLTGGPVRNHDFLLPLLEKPNVRVLLAASHRDSAYEMDHLKQGLFTYLLCNGVLSRKADGNGDGEIFLEEAYQWVKNNCSDLSGYKGRPQNPQALGTGSMKVLLRRPVDSSFDTPEVPSGTQDESPLTQ